MDYQGRTYRRIFVASFILTTIVMIVSGSIPNSFAQDETVANQAAIKSDAYSAEAAAHFIKEFEDATESQMSPENRNKIIRFFVELGSKFNMKNFKYEVQRFMNHQYATNSQLAMDIAFMFVLSHLTETSFLPVIEVMGQSGNWNPAIMRILEMIGVTIVVPGLDPLCISLAFAFKKSNTFRKGIRISRVNTVGPIAKAGEYLYARYLRRFTGEETKGAMYENLLLDYQNELLERKYLTQSNKVQYSLKNTDQKEFAQLRFKIENNKLQLVEIEIDRERAQKTNSKEILAALDGFTGNLKHLFLKYQKFIRKNPDKLFTDSHTINKVAAWYPAFLNVVSNDKVKVVDEFSIDQVSTKKNSVVFKLKNGVVPVSPTKKFFKPVRIASEKINKVMGIKGGEPIAPAAMMNELKEIIAKIKQPQDYAKKEEVFQRHKSRLLEIQNDLITQKEYRGSVVAQLGSVNAVGRAVNGMVQAKLEFPKFLLAGMLANTWAEIFDPRTTVEDGIGFMDRTYLLFKANARFAFGAAASGWIFDTFTPMITKKFEMSYREQVMSQILMRTKKYTMQSIFAKESKVMDRFVRSQFMMLGASFVDMMFFREKRPSPEQMLKELALTQATFSVSQAITRGILVRSVASSEILAGIRAGSRVNFVVGTVVFSVVLLFQDQLNRSFLNVEQEYKLQDQIMRNLDAFRKNNNDNHFHAILESMETYWNQVIMRDVQNVTYKYEQKQNKIDKDLNFTKTIESEDEKLYPMIGEEMSTQSERNDLWRAYWIEAGEAQRKIKESIGTPILNEMRRLDHAGRKIDSIREECMQSENQNIQNCGYKLFAALEDAGNAQSELFRHAFRFKSMPTSFLTALRDAQFFPKKLTPTEWVKVMLAIANQGSASQRHYIFQFLQNTLDHESRVTPEDFQIQKPILIRAYNNQIKKYQKANIKKQTLTVLVPADENPMQEAATIFLEMAYLNKCRVKKNPNLNKYYKNQKMLESDAHFQKQLSMFQRQMKNSAFGNALNLPSDLNWKFTKAKMKEEDELGFLNVLQIMKIDRLGSPYTKHILTTPIFESDLGKFENILTCTNEMLTAAN